MARYDKGGGPSTRLIHNFINLYRLKSDEISENIQIQMNFDILNLKEFVPA